jgi:hypothetical protein
MDHIFVESLHGGFPKPHYCILLWASLNPMKPQCGVSSKVVTDGVSLLIQAHGSSIFSAAFAMVTFDTLAFSSG